MVFQPNQLNFMQMASSSIGRICQRKRSCGMTKGRAIIIAPPNSVGAFPAAPFHYDISALLLEATLAFRIQIGKGTPLAIYTFQRNRKPALVLGQINMI